jgi:hypothetical protein
MSNDGVRERLEAVFKRLGAVDTEDLVDIVNSKDGYLAQALVYVVDGPKEIDYDLHDNPEMLFWEEDMRRGGKLTALEKNVIARARKEITKRVVHRTRHGKRGASKAARGGRKRKTRKRKSKRKGRGRCGRATQRR